MLVVRSTFLIEVSNAQPILRTLSLFQRPLDLQILAEGDRDGEVCRNSVEREAEELRGKIVGRILQNYDLLSL